MTTGVFGILAASVVGSVHCAGMCGPLVAAYAGMPGTSAPWRQRALRHAAYSLGRLAAYVGLGAVAGSVGAAVDRAAGLAGISRAASILCGALIALFGLHAFLSASGVARRLVVPRPLTRGLARWMRSVAAFAAGPRAFLLGAGSALLPCGWLYAFVVAAGGAGSASSGAIVMAWFWLGTLPMMVAFGEAVRTLSGPMRKHVPAACALLLVAMGLWTVFARAEARPSPSRTGSSHPACHAAR